MLVATGDTTVTYLVVVVNVEGIKCRTLLDTRAGSSFASSTLLKHLKKRPINRESTNQVTEFHKLKISNVDGSFHLEMDVKKVNRSQLLSLGNPKYKEKVARFSHLQGIIMDDTDKKAELPIHLILGAVSPIRVIDNS